MNKKEARQLALLGRKDKDQSMASSVILDAILSSQVLEQFHTIGIYYPLGREIDLMPLVTKYPEKIFYLPKTKDEISFVLYKNKDTLIPGPFHTMEPIGEETPRDSIECFILPCVGIMRDNRRIGYGKGYYDRYLDGYQGYTIGIVYDNAIFDIEGDIFDISVNQVFRG